MGLVPFGELKSYFQKLELETPGGLCSSRGIDSSVVVVGCGTSNLSADLQEVFGFRQVLSIDYSDAVISHMKARFGSCDALSFHQADLTQPCGHVVPDGTADLVVDKSTLDCLLCSEGAVGLICNISRMLRVGGLYVVISFHEAEFLVGFLSLAFTVESVTSLKRSTGADVRALSLRKTAEEGACCLRARLQSWEARRKSLLTPRRAETMEAAWLASSRTGAVDQPCLPIEEAYLAMFTDTEERREYMLADFERVPIRNAMMPKKPSRSARHRSNRPSPADMDAAPQYAHALTKGTGGTHSARQMWLKQRHSVGRHRRPSRPRRLKI
ncbi:unnamed protein product [Effrenium voratum]|nr:unnamed protein product [Effrenium voratum]